MEIARVRFGLVGAGRIGQTYARALAASRQACLVAVADPRGDAVHALGVHACPSFPSATAMLEAADLDAVVICTPPSSHAELCLQALAAGIPVLCEKPFTISVESAERVCDAARLAGVPLSMASKFRSVDGVRRARDLLRAGTLGAVNLLEIGFTAPVDMRERWHVDPRISGGGVLIDNGVHAADLLSVFLGPVTEVWCIEGPRPQALPVEETVHLVARGRGGALGVVDLSWSLRRETDDFLCLYGTDGAVTVGWGGSKCRLRSDADWQPLAGPYDKHAAFVRQLDDFARAVRGEPSLSLTPEDALASVAFVEAAYNALRTAQGCRSVPLPTTTTAGADHEHVHPSHSHH
jgi:predicted dehydrogenase